jgi:hypothetical protein
MKKAKFNGYAFRQGRRPSVLGNLRKRIWVPRADLQEGKPA